MQKTYEPGHHFGTVSPNSNLKNLIQLKKTNKHGINTLQNKALISKFQKSGN